MTWHVPLTKKLSTTSLSSGVKKPIPFMAFLLSRYDTKSTIYNWGDHYACAKLHLQLIPNKSFDFFKLPTSIDTLHRPSHAYNDLRLPIMASAEHRRNPAQIIPDSYTWIAIFLGTSGLYIIHHRMTSLSVDHSIPILACLCFAIHSCKLLDYFALRFFRLVHVNDWWSAIFYILVPHLNILYFFSMYFCFFCIDLRRRRSLW